jgi:hypothetical protein
MARIYYDELRAALSSNIFDTLTTESNESQREMESIDTFNHAGRKELTGENYDHFREQLAKMKEALSNRANLATNLNNSIREALTLLINYMESYQFLDSSRLEEYNTYRTNCINGINYLNTLLHQQNRTDYNIIYQNIETVKNTLSELDKIIAKVEGLDSVYQQAQQILTEAFYGIDYFNSRVSDIKPDGLYTYSIS